MWIESFASAEKPTARSLIANVLQLVWNVIRCVFVMNAKMKQNLKLRRSRPALAAAAANLDASKIIVNATFKVKF